jgi:light-regulated signal transduction histidine kinase (bacteriophytochrome)
VELLRGGSDLDVLAHVVSHDLRAPLRCIDGFSRALDEDCGNRLDEAGHGHLRRVRGAARQMSEMIDGLAQLLDIARAEIHPTSIDVSELAHTTVRDLGRREPARKVEIAIEDGIRAVADGRLLRVALSCLLDNAWKFTSRRDDARIALRNVRRDGQPIYEVSDNGVGLPEGSAPTLFRPFRRVHGDAFPGIGMGLAIVRQIVTRHGGVVGAEGRPDGGAAFFFTLPETTE